MGIKSQIENLKKTFKEEYGLVIDISISAHTTDNKLTENEAFIAGGKISEELGIELTGSELDDSMCLKSNYGEGLAYISIFYNKPTKRVNINKTLKELGDYVTLQLESGNITSDDFFHIAAGLDEISELIPNQKTIVSV
jgi:hypothetical protein